MTVGKFISILEEMDKDFDIKFNFATADEKGFWNEQYAPSGLFDIGYSDRIVSMDIEKIKEA